MLAPVIAGFALLQSNPFVSPIAVVETTRLALTPKIDGVIAANEWDMFGGDLGKETYFQWEPNAVHAAAKLGAGQDLVLSLDVRSNGWLIGRDNVEIRAHWDGSTATLAARQLDATDPSGPKWIGVPEMLRLAQVKGSPSADGWTVEFTVRDPGLELLRREADDAVGVRLDAIAPGEYEPYLPRATTQCRFSYDRESNVPAGLKWRPQLVTRDVAMGGSMRMRMTFEGTNALGLSRIDMESKWPDGIELAKYSLPFPTFDSKGRAFVDYNLKAPEACDPGYRLLKTVVTDGQGASTFFRTSYRVAPLLELELVRPSEIKVSPNEQRRRFAFYIRSNSMRKVQGTTSVTIPDRWRQETGDDKGFVIATARGAVRRVFDAVIPPNAKGLYPIEMKAVVGDRTFENVAYVRIQ